MDPLGFLLSFLVFPGFLFAGVVGLLYVGIDRKVTGHMQHRIGPPIWQEFLDVGKLLGKEDITPGAAQSLYFTAAPLVALGAIVAVMLYLPVSSAQPSLIGVADLIVVIYLLNIPAICVMVGGYSSACPFGATGAARYVVQLFGYELAFIIAALAAAARAGTLALGEIVAFQAMRGWLLFDPRVLPAALAALVAAQGKLLRVPFDIPEAETEIVHGALTEYSGPKLALFRITYDIEVLAVAGLFAALFLGGPTSYVVAEVQIPAVVDFLVKTLIVVLITTTIRNIAARLRIDQALRFFWTYVAGLALLGLILVMVF